MLRIYVVGKPKKGFIKNGVDEFIKRLSPYKVEVNFIKESGIPRSPSLYDDVKEKEWIKLLKYKKSSEKLFLWDVRGELWSTDNLVSLFQRSINQGNKLFMVIGGPLGVPERAYRESDYVVSLSRFTFTHQMALLMVLEQVYRVFKIINGEPYAY